MENNSQAIELKGIVRNQTKIGVQDGQCDDIVNLRFKDGSWRVADDGKVMLDADNGVPFNATGYSQLYVHTNVYHHLLGVKQGKLYWFANIGSDGESFTFVKNTNGVPSPTEICDVQGDVTIVQNGHLLTIISTATTDTTPLPLADSSESLIKYAIFKTGTNEYKELKVNPSGEQTDRGLYPFGRVHLNLNCDAKEFTHVNRDAGKIKMDLENPGANFFVTLNHNDSGALVPADNDEEAERTLTAKQLWHSSMLDVYNQAKEENYFSKPFLAIVAVKLYDGSYIYASAPIFLSPIEKYSSYKEYYDPFASTDKATAAGDKLYYQHNMVHPSDEETELKHGGYDQTLQVKKIKVADTQILYSKGTKNLLHPMGDRMPIYYNGAYSYRIGVGSDSASDFPYTDEYLEEKLGYLPYQFLTSVLRGSSLVVTLGDLSSIFDNSDVFSSLSIFITKEVDIYKMGVDNYKDGTINYLADAGRRDNADGATASYTIFGNVWYKPAIRPDDEIIHDLTNSPFYLLREYSLNELKSMSNTSLEVDLSSPQYKGLLANIEQQYTLDIEAFERKEFIPKTAYQYNQKLHIANYKAKLFHGYPIDCFQLSNHNVKTKEGSFAVNGTLPNLEDIANVQYSREKLYFIDANDQDAQRDYYINIAKQKGTFFAYIKVYIEAQQGAQEVVRYIAPYDSYNFKNGDAPNFIEDLSPLLTFPDTRATKMEIRIVSLARGKYVEWAGETFDLKPHPYLNIAYYICPSLRPISINNLDDGGSIDLSIFDDEEEDISYYIVPIEKNNTEDYPNGLKVSLTNNPFTFPYESTYQVGSSEIIALMSNAVAVGTGQTGAAPLYVFCKDGIYSLMVDATGEMTYTNARIIARDVCNNAKSVTPIDSGVVFTTDRGIMSIAGSEVVEIGSAAEGDVFDITDTSDKAKKIMFNAFTMQQLAEFPQSLVDNTDFLTYLKGAIVNYNHNERELMVSNPDKDYTYVMDRNGNWSRRAFTAQEYVNNYPTSYRIDKAVKLYKVDADDNDTNNVYLLSNVIKLGTIAFKQAYRLVVRGYFETTAYPLAFGYINGKLVRVEGLFVDRMEKGEELKMSYITKYGQSLWVNINDDSILSGGITIYDQSTNEDVTETVVSVDSGNYYIIQRTENYSTVGCYVFGSYDGRQWALLGGNEKEGKFTDIGCKISHTDIRFLRVCLSGKLSKDTRIDYIEVSADGSALNGKLR